MSQCLNTSRRRMTWYPWAGGATGLLMTGLLALYLFGIAKWNGRAARDAAQLTESNQGLTQEIAKRKEMERRQTLFR